MARTVLGISCHYHDASAALVHDGQVVAAAQEERFDRRKYSAGFPIRAINTCLAESGVSIPDLDAVAFYEKPFLKLGRTLVGHLRAWPRSLRNFLDTMPTWLEDRLALPLQVRDELGFDGDVLFLKHHLSHAASSFLASPFESAAILTVDGIGEWASTTWGSGHGNRISIEQELRYPNSVGLLYAIVTTHLGFRVFAGEGKVMALAAFGEPRYLDAFRKLVQIRDDGSFRLAPEYFNFQRGDRMYNRRFTDLFGPAREAESAFDPRHHDIAASLQAITEEILLTQARHVHARTGLTDLCLAGGVFLNVVANTRILHETPFERLFIQPAAGDAGGALGAALYVHTVMLGGPRGEPMQHAALGPAFDDRRIGAVIAGNGVDSARLEEAALLDDVAGRIADGQVIGWYQGRMEFGPRALGNRSILGDARNPQMKDLLNHKVKHREGFRPYGVSVLAERAGEFFDLEAPSPYMLLVGNARPGMAERIPSALHVDGTCRLQTITEEGNGRYARLVRRFDQLTGVPMVINTSFNVRGEPIVCSPQDAWACFAGTGIDCLVMGNHLVTREGAGLDTG
jgi:carbamoyltransferase